MTRSAGLIRQRWGEGIAGNVVIVFAFVVAAIPLGILLGAGVAVLPVAPAVGVPMLLVALIGWVAAMAASSAVREIFAVALYRYATDGTVMGGFPEADLQAPFTKKRRRLFRRGNND